MIYGEKKIGDFREACIITPKGSCESPVYGGTSIGRVSARLKFTLPLFLSRVPFKLVVSALERFRHEDNPAVRKRARIADDSCQINVKKKR